MCVQVIRPYILRCSLLPLSYLLRPSPPPSLLHPGVFEIVAADEGDSSVYICTANGVSATYRVTIEDPPSDITTPSDIATPQGQSLRI